MIYFWPFQYVSFKGWEWYNYLDANIWWTWTWVFVCAIFALPQLQPQNQIYTNTIRAALATCIVCIRMWTFNLWDDIALALAAWWRSHPYECSSWEWIVWSGAGSAVWPGPGRRISCTGAGESITREIRSRAPAWRDTADTAECGCWNRPGGIILCTVRISIHAMLHQQILQSHCRGRP